MSLFIPFKLIKLFLDKTNFVNFSNLLRLNPLIDLIPFLYKSNFYKFLAKGALAMDSTDEKLK